MLTIMILGIHSCWEGMHGLKPAQAHWFFLNTFASCLGFIIYIGLNHVFTPPLHDSLADSGRPSHSFNELKEPPVNQLLIGAYLKKSYPLVPFMLR